MTSEFDPSEKHSLNRDQSGLHHLTIPSQAVTLPIKMSGENTAIKGT